MKEFSCDDDVWEIIDLLIEEVKFNNEKSGKEFDIVQSVNAQIPFFACRNILYTKEAQEDIQRYLYCKEFGVSPYEGDYSKHPAKWIDKAFIIKKAIAKQERKLRDVRKDSNKI